MGKHNDNEFRQKIQMSFREKLNDQLKNGLAQGMYAACKIIRNKAMEEDKTPEERLHNIISFCEPVLHLSNSKESESMKAGD